MLGYVFETFENIVKYLMPLQREASFHRGPGNNEARPCVPRGLDIRESGPNRPLMGPDVDLPRDSNFFLRSLAIMVFERTVSGFERNGRTSEDRWN